MFAHLHEDALVVLMTDVSDLLELPWRLFKAKHSLFSKKLNNIQRNYSMYNHELLTVYEVIKYVKDFVKGKHNSSYGWTISH